MKYKTLRFVLTAMALFFVQSALAFYNPSTGRWLSRDPIAEKGGKNLYQYVNNNALSKFDPNGKIAFPAWWPLTWPVWGGAAGYCGNVGLCALNATTKLFRGEREADRVAPDGSTHAGTGARPGNDADALTHCIAACELAKEPGLCGGPDRALEIMQSREGSGIDSQVDKANNEVGMGVAMGLDKGETCTQGCLAALKNHLLSVIQNGVIVPSPNPPQE